MMKATTGGTLNTSQRENSLLSPKYAKSKFDNKSSTSQSLSSSGEGDL